MARDGAAQAVSHQVHCARIARAIVNNFAELPSRSSNCLKARIVKIGNIVEAGEPQISREREEIRAVAAETMNQDYGFAARRRIVSFGLLREPIERIRTDQESRCGDFSDDGFGI